MHKPIPIIDLFAGPGGLGEGFSSLKDEAGNPVFQIIMSVEMDPLAHRTLRLRAFFRAICRSSDGRIPQVYLDYVTDPTQAKFAEMIATFPAEWEAADEEAVCATLKLGDDSLVEMAAKRLEAYGADTFVLIGGPPCQAYSLVGRSRRTRDKEGLQNDVKQTLYKCYLQFIERLKPSAFVMENVKGMLSAKLSGGGVFNLIRNDMNELGYAVHSLSCENPTQPQDFLVKSERYGIPQARHRVILLGLREESARTPAVLQPVDQPVVVKEAFSGIPPLRSGFSPRGKNSEDDWGGYIRRIARDLAELDECEALKDELISVAEGELPSCQRQDSVVLPIGGPLAEWYRGGLEEDILLNHEARSHMPSDLGRYLFCSTYAKVHGRPAKLQDFPASLLPAHKNVNSQALDSVIFGDRFRVQSVEAPATTVTSHISKDGHYYIHPDPAQCRSLTVREAARLQTFPDTYFFEGNRTSQYQQVGNAVPPLLASKIAKIVSDLL